MKTLNHLGAVLCLLFLVGCMPSAYTVPKTEQEAVDAIYRAADDSRPPNERLRWANIALRYHDLTDEDIADLHYYRGSAYYDMERYDDAYRAYGEVLRRFPRDGMTHGARGNVSYVQGYYDDAIDEYRRAYELTRDRRWEHWANQALEDKRHNREPLAVARARERDAQRRRQYDPPADQPTHDTQIDPYRYQLMFVGFHAERIQKDSVFHPANEVFLYVAVRNNGDLVHKQVAPPKGTFNNVKNGTWRKIVPYVMWTGAGGPIDISVAAFEHDNGGPAVEMATGYLLSKRIPFGFLFTKEVSKLPKGVFGTHNDLIGHGTFTNVHPANNLANAPLVRGGIEHHLSITLSRAGARYHFFFRFQERTPGR